MVDDGACSRDSTRMTSDFQFPGVQLCLLDKVLGMAGGAGYVPRVPELISGLTNGAVPVAAVESLA